MRDYLFRGKRKDNGEWVYGYYTELPVGSLGATIFSNDDEIVCEDTASYIIKVFEKQHSNYSNGNPLLVIECENYEVIPETVGQFTGLTDKNGKKIFEGDIVSRYVNRLDKRVNASVKNNTTVASWICEFFLYKDKKEVFLANRVGKNDCYVIGNIHDNPELLKGGDGNA